MHAHTPTHGPRAAGLFWLRVGVPSWYLRLVDWQSRSRQHTDRDTLCQAATSANYKTTHCYNERQRQRRKARTECVCEREKDREGMSGDNDVKKKRKWSVSKDAT